MPISELVVTWLGVGLIGLVVLWLVLESVKAFRGILLDREHRRLSLVLLDEQIRAARALHKRNELARSAWNGYRKFVVDRKVPECDGVCSFYLVPHDGKPLPDYRPGQFLTFQLDIPGHSKPVVRCYSLSDSTSTEQWRISIKRVAAPPEAPRAPAGLISNHFHEAIHEGDILDVKSPSGNFVIDPFKARPAVLLAGGIGVTPLLSMAQTVRDLGSDREIWFFYGVRNKREHAFRESLGQLVKEQTNIRIVTCYSEPGDEDRLDQDFDHGGHISVDLLKQYLDSSNYEFYVCGPPPMMQALTEQLSDWGVPKTDVHTEAFGPASVKAKPQTEPAEDVAPTSTWKVKFAKCGKELAWNPNAENLLDFGESNGVPLEGGCRAGNCGTCEIAVIAGNVDYLRDPEFSDLEEGCCLTCIGVPKGDLVLDA